MFYVNDVDLTTVAHFEVIRWNVAQDRMATYFAFYELTILRISVGMWHPALGVLARIYEVTPPAFDHVTVAVQHGV